LLRLPIRGDLPSDIQKQLATVGLEQVEFLKPEEVRGRVAVDD
jgi:hypothetical protein